MSIEKTQALALRISPYSNTSHIVSWLTESGERLTTLVKGACRPKSAFQGQYDLFADCELLYYRRDGEGLHIARECALLEPRSAFRKDWRAFGGAAYVGHVVLQSSMAGQRDPAASVLARTALDALSTSGARLETLYWFELQWLGHLGLAPQLRQCARCQRGLAGPEPGMQWARDGAVCGTCAGARDGDGHGRAAPLTPLPPDAYAILRRWQDQPEVRVLATTQCSERQYLEFDRILGTLMHDHMDDSGTVACRKIALRLMRAGTASREKTR